MTGNTSTQGSRSPYKNNGLSEPTSATTLLYPVRVSQHLRPAHSRVCLVCLMDRALERGLRGWCGG